MSNNSEKKWGLISDPGRETHQQRAPAYLRWRGSRKARMWADEMMINNPKQKWGLISWPGRETMLPTTASPLLALARLRVTPNVRR